METEVETTVGDCWTVNLGGRIVGIPESSFVSKGVRDCDRAVHANRCGVCKCKAELRSY
jgi:hypothetical protein